MNMDGDTGDRASAIRSEIRVSLLDEWRFRVKQAWAEIDTLQAENARLRGDLDTALGLRRMESRRVDTVRDQAEALAAALEATKQTAGQLLVLKEATGVIPADLAEVFVSRACEMAAAALRAYREGDCPGCSFRRQTGGNHDDVPTGDADPNCPYREGS